MIIRPRAFMAASLIFAISHTASRAADTEGFESKINLGATLTDGNSDTMNANLGLDTKRIAGEDQIKAGADVNYGEAEDETVTQNVTADGQFRKMLGETWYGYAGADFLYDDIASVGYRVTVGPGLGIDLVDNDTTRLNAEAGTVWVAEDVGDDSDSNFVAWRISQVFEHALSETARVWQKATLVPEIGDFENFELTAEIGAESAMTERINLRVVVKDRFDNTPALKNGVSLEENDITLVGGISIKL